MIYDIVKDACKILKKVHQNSEMSLSYDVAYENACANYKEEYLENDKLYCLFYKDNYYRSRGLKKIIDESYGSRELRDKLNSYMHDEIDDDINEHKIAHFLALLFTELLNTKEYSPKISELRLDIESEDTNLKINELHEYMIGNNNNRIEEINAEYANAYNEVMFLHKNNTENEVRLRDVFIPPKCQFVSRPFIHPQTEDEGDALERIKQFIIPTKERKKEKWIPACLFIEGSAGVGKSTLVTYLAHLHANDISARKEIFDDRELVCVRLRDIIPGGLKFNHDSIVADMLKYLGRSSAKHFQKRYSNAVVILDGVDELCMVEGINEHASHYIHELYFNLFKYCKLIVTTRPQYLNIRGLDIRKDHIILTHFDETQRGEWVERYRKVSFDPAEETALDYILNINDDDASGICDTPMALYMLAAGKINEDAKQNHWALYRQIFAKELSETEYNSIFPDKFGTHTHAIKKYSEEIYRVSAEISYEMFKSENQKLSLNSDEISDIIKNMNFDNSKVREIVNHCYALCGYWKANKEKGAVEFYHNNIRDFFMCEKIFFEMDKLYKKCENVSSGEMVETMKTGIYNLFHYSEINSKVIKFLYLRIKYQEKDKWEDNFAKREQVHKYLPMIFQFILLGTITAESGTTLRKAHKFMINTISNTIQIYRHAYEYYINKDNPYINWSNNSRALALWADYLIKQIFIKKPLTIDGKPIYTMGNGNFGCVSFKYADLRFAGFGGSLLKNAEFMNTILHSADFEGAILDNTGFKNADLSNASFKNCSLFDCDFPYANMRNCNLKGCDFEEALFTNAVLPDGFSTNDNNKAKEHLKKLEEDGFYDKMESASSARKELLTSGADAT